MTIPMALFDFVPVFLFGAAGVLLLRNLYRAMSKGAYALLAGGLIMSFFAGFFKAIWKLLYAANICDFEVFNRMFLPTQALGFLLTGLSLIALLSVRQHRVYSAAAPAAFSGSMIFIAMMVLGCAGMCGSLAVLAKKMKKPAAIMLFLLAFVLMMAMGYLAAKADQASAMMNWLEEAVNTCGQLCLLLGVLALQKAGLADVQDVRAL